MKRLSISDFKDYCFANNIRSFVLKGQEVCDNIKLSLSFDKLLLSSELMSATFISNDSNKLSLNNINYIDIEERQDDVLFIFSCGLNESGEEYVFFSPLKREMLMRNEKNNICNKCGKALDVWDKENNFSINNVIKYGSIYDGEKINLHLCCECMDDLINSCVISPIHTP